MKISTIVPTYKRHTYLEKCLDSLASQSRPPDEIVLITRNDDIESHEIVKNFEIRCKERNIEIKNVDISRPGIVPSENLGLKNASGDIVCFIDDDSVALEDWIERIEKYFKDERVGAVGGPVISCVDDKPIIEKTKYVGKVLWFGFVIDEAVRITEKLMYVDHLAGSNMSYRKELLNKFDENLIGHYPRFEMDACLSIRNRGYMIVFDPHIRIHHYSAPITEKPNVKNSIYELNYNNTYVLLKHFSFPQKAIFLLFTFLIGDIASNGFLMMLVRIVKYKNPSMITELVPAFRGKIGGIKAYIEKRKS